MDCHNVEDVTPSYDKSSGAHGSDGWRLVHPGLWTSLHRGLRQDAGRSIRSRDGALGEEMTHTSHEKNPALLSMGNPGWLIGGFLFHGFNYNPYING